MCCSEQTEAKTEIQPMFPQEAQFARQFWNQIAPEMFSLAGMDIKRTPQTYIGSLDTDTRKKEMKDGKQLPDMGMENRFDARTAYMMNNK